MLAYVMRILLAVLLGCAVSFGQSAGAGKNGAGPGQQVIRINVDLVQLDAVVTDKKGRQVTDLSADDFEVLQDGRPQAITNLSYVRVADPGPEPQLHGGKGSPESPPLPPVKLTPDKVRRTIALVVDDLSLTFEDIARVRQTLADFVDRQMQPGDLVAIVRTGEGSGSLQGFTTDKRLLHAAIDRVRFGLGRRAIGTFAFYGGADASDQEEVFAAGTLGAVRYVVNGLGRLPGRKSVVLFSEQIPGFSSARTNPQVLENMHRLVDAANRAAAVIYTIDPSGLETFQLTAEENIHRLGTPMVAEASRRAQAKFIAQAGLETIAEQTGGLFIYNDNRLDDAIHDVLEDQAGYYLIGYQPAAGTFDPKTGRRLFHRVKLRLKRRPGLTVRSRTGFFGVADKAPDAMSARGLSREEQLANAISSPFDSSGIGIRLMALFARTPQPTSLSLPARQGEKRTRTVQVSDFLDAILYINFKDLTFTDINEPAKGGEPYTKKAVLDLLILTYGDQGQVVDSTDKSYTMLLPEKSYQQALRKGGLVYTALHPVRKPGAYQVRVAIRDAISQRVGSASQFVEIPDASKGRLLLSSLLLSSDAGQAARLGPDAAPDASSVLRAFEAGTRLDYAFEVLNARAGPKGIQLQVQRRLFKEGRRVYEGSPEPLEAAGLSAPGNFTARGAFPLDVELSPGDYVLQVVVTDDLEKDPRHKTASTWQNFEVAAPAASAEQQPR